MSGSPVFPPPRNPDDLGRGPMVMGITWTFTGLAILSTLLRMYVRKRLSPKLAIDDWLMLCAMLFQTVAQAFVTVGFHYGMGKHQYDLWIPDEIVPMSMWEWLSVPPGLASGILGRISICVLLVRLFGIHKWFRYYAIILTACGSIMSALIAICLYASRSPVQSLWNPFIPATHWGSNVVQDMMFLGQSFYALADLTFVIFPIIIVSKLHMTLGRRLGLIALMALSLFTCAMSIMKGVSAIDEQSGTDAAYTSTLSLLWATLEQACVVLLGNIVPLRALMKLEIPFIERLTTSMVSLLGRSSRARSRPSAVSENFGNGNGAYHDIEMNSQMLGNQSHAMYKITGDNSFHNTPIQNSQVRRTDKFTVDYTG